MKRSSMENEVCAVARSLDVIGDWWTLLIVRDALAGLRRFGEFQRSLGAAKNILTTRLRALVAQGILETAPASDGSAYQEYRLTAKGRALVPVLVALGQWSNEHVFLPEQERILPVDRAQRLPIQPLQVVAADGRRLAPEEVHFDAPQRPPAGLS
ncbi:helix-turn-helix domain-containing protein [Rugamonas sp.]|uniref:winged helix-turn-helix transcriptional regulator n=1 Tax=Rugamonas sp. TaxID=1926287 RepID=UPI0025D8B585|nr:helix-turn-helix domain-containing protein [Rugamonas sp.]